MNDGFTTSAVFGNRLQGRKIRSAVEEGVRWRGEEEIKKKMLFMQWLALGREGAVKVA